MNSKKLRCFTGMFSSSNFRYAVNAATEACFANHFKQFSRDLANYQIKSMTMLYSEQTRPGDNLDIYMWEDSTERRIHCQIEKSNQTVYNTTIDFF